MNTVSISVSSQPYSEKLEQGDRHGWANLYRSLTPVELDAAGIADALYKGYVIGPVLDGWRSYSHFIQAQHIGIVMDTEDSHSAMSNLIDHDLVQMYGAILHSTPNSTPSKPRTRIIFLLDQPITDPHRYKAAIKTLSYYFPGHDKGSAEATRTFFGNAKLAKTHSVDGIYFSDSRFPLHELRRLYKAQQAKHERLRTPIDYTQADIDIEKMVQTCISKASVGGRNNLCYWMACRLVENGVSDVEQENAVMTFAHAVTGSDPFTEQEAIACLRSARTGA